MSSGAGGYNPEASLLSANPGVDLKVFAGGGLNATVGAGAYNNSVSMLHAPTDPVPVVKFSGGNPDDGNGDNGTEISSLSTNASDAYRTNYSQIPASIPPQSNIPSDQFNFIIDVLGFPKDVGELDSIKNIKSIDEIKNIDDNDAQMIYKQLLNDKKFKEFLRAKGIAVNNNIQIPNGNAEEMDSE